MELLTEKRKITTKKATNEDNDNINIINDVL